METGKEQGEGVRDDIRMNEQEVQRLLRAGGSMTLSTHGPRGFPHAIAMFYALDDDGSVRMASYENSQKVRNIERDPKVALLVERGDAYDELHGVMIEGIAELSKDLDATVATMIEATASTGTQLPEISTIPEAVKEKMAGKRVLIRVRPQRVVSWDHAKLPKSKTPAAVGG
jgi:PPOX class probable F420-dependent enzyme